MRSDGFETSELRWFGTGELPHSIKTWFLSAAVIVEHRSDTYCVDGSVDLGVKRRNGVGLEAKIRRGTGSLVTLGAGVEAVVEDWVKLTNLEDADLDGSSAAAVWVEVTKSVWSRIYQFDERGGVSQVTTRDLSAPACDVELAEVTIGDHEAWTFAFEAWGPSDERLRLLVSTAGVLMEEGIHPELLTGLRFGMGYPEWLAGLVDVT